MTSSLLGDFRFLDSMALAAEHGVPLTPTSLIPSALASVGVMFELAVLAYASRPWSTLSKGALPRNLATPLRKAKAAPLTTFRGRTLDSEFGFMCLSSVDNDTFRPALFAFDTEARRAMQFRRNVGASKGLVCGAIGEMLDNVFEHSQRPESGMVGYMASSEYLDICVCDAGIGVLSSLKKNPAYAYLADAGMALALATKEGTSRFPTDHGGEGRGHGFRTLFRGLNSLDAEIRLRTDNYALEVSGRGNLDRGPTISQKAHLRGFVVSFRIHH